MSGIGRIVVVGNGIAGLTAADSLRDNSYDGELTIVGLPPRGTAVALNHRIAMPRLRWLSRAAA
ncbi:hypothetical protein FPZ12_026305 [Amycolatopsis acidicola]|uniref:Uncharacterized protein n=1 Tax=Amycolatopsis acidicola TaxID=2596893 RepID=A0A5N0UZB0_9PSEU|nr:hypothetical protein [Amycolatopsis acidicola]KAA9156931.1 hypothetical protein FPZ12_026305 [Amycolatopsis acidicola]